MSKKRKFQNQERSAHNMKKRRILTMSTPYSIRFYDEVEKCVQCYKKKKKIFSTKISIANSKVLEKLVLEKLNMKDLDKQIVDLIYKSTAAT